MTEKISEKIGSVVIDLADLVVDGKGFVSERKIKPHLDRLQSLKNEVEELEETKRTRAVVLPFLGQVNKKEQSDDLPPVA